MFVKLFKHRVECFQTMCGQTSCCRLESSDLNTALSRIGLLAQAKEGPVAWLEHSVHFPVFGVGQELALELPRTTAKMQVCIFFAG